MDDQILSTDTRFTSLTKELYEWVESMLLVVVVMVLIFTFAVRTVGVFGESMEDTLHEGDTLITTSLTGAPKQGDIVALTNLEALGKPLIKRVIATGGQTIDIDFTTGDVTVDGILLEEPYIAERIEEDSEGDMQFPQTVPEGCIFVMGDNRNYSTDSRYLSVGMVDQRHILGKVIFRVLPVDRIGLP